MLQSLIARVNREMEDYRLYNVIPPILGFIDDLTNWYIRRSRRRFWSQRGVDDDEDKLAAFATLYQVLVTFAKVAAPVLPFISEELYQRLVRDLDPDAQESVHHTDYPLADQATIDSALEEQMATVRSIVNLGHGLRKRHEVKVRQPLATLTVVSRDPQVVAAVTSHRDLIAEELNVGTVTIEAVEDHLVHLSAQANFKLLGPRLGAATKAVAAEISELPHEAVSSILDGNTVQVSGYEIGGDDIIVRREPRAGLVVAADGPLSVALDVTVTPELAMEGTAREIISSIQSARRDLGLRVSDRVAVTWHSADDAIAAAMSSHGDLIAGELLATRLVRSDEPQRRSLDINGATVSVTVEPV